jgi:hypothetical protein
LGAQALRDAQRRNYIRSRRGTREDRFLARKSPSHCLGIFRGHRRDFVYLLRLPQRGSEPREMPVVPAVYSTIVPPGASRPSAAARCTIARAILSFILPVGLADSSFATTRAQPFGTTRCSPTIGVFPILSMTPLCSGIFALTWLFKISQRAYRAVVIEWKKLHRHDTRYI